VPSGLTKPSPHAFQIFSFFSAASTTPEWQMIYHMPNCCFCNHGDWLSLWIFHWGFWCFSFSFIFSLFQCTHNLCIFLKKIQFAQFAKLSNFCRKNTFHTEKTSFSKFFWNFFHNVEKFCHPKIIPQSSICTFFNIVLLHKQCAHILTYLVLWTAICYTKYGLCIVTHYGWQKKF
jgi:hypothetical protein